MEAKEQFANSQLVFFIGELYEELKNLKSFSTEISGVKKLSKIIEELFDGGFNGEVEVIKNNQFELVYLLDEEKVEFRTTFSNQVIDQNYMNQMMMINQRQSIISSLMKSIDKLR